MILARKEGFKLYKELLKKNPLFKKNAMYILAKGPFNKESYLIFKLTINDKLLISKINKITFFVTMTIFLITIFSVFLLKYIKNILNYLDEFTFHIKNQTVYTKQTYPELDEVINAPTTPQ
ncbi:MAG: hypothetical protein ABGX25_01955 [Nautiliaceae bacterium]